MSFSNNLEAKVLQHFFGGIAQKRTANIICCALCTDRRKTILVPK